MNGTSPASSTASIADAVFAECGFLSNPEEAEKLCDENYQKKLAAAIADGIIAFCKAE